MSRPGANQPAFQRNKVNIYLKTLTKQIIVFFQARLWKNLIWQKSHKRDSPTLINNLYIIFMPINNYYCYASFIYFFVVFTHKHVTSQCSQ